MINREMITASPFFLNEAQCAWVEETLKAVTQERKVGQLLCVNFKVPDSRKVDYIFHILDPGGCMYRPFSAEYGIRMANTLRERSKVPMLYRSSIINVYDGVYHSAK